MGRPKEVQGVKHFNIATHNAYPVLRRVQSTDQEGCSQRSQVVALFPAEAGLQWPPSL